MFSGYELYLLSSKKKNLTDKELSNILGITINDILMYQYGVKEVPLDIYNKWVNISV